MDGSMLLIEFIEIKHKFSGMDLGINFLHEFLSLSDVRRRVGVVVMYPWAINNERVMRYDDNMLRLRGSLEGKSESEKVDIYRSNSVKLRVQYARMGLAAVADTPDWANKWFMSMQKYKRMEPADIKRAWLSKESASWLSIPMPVKEYVKSEKDNELKQLLQGIMPENDPYGGMNSRVEQQFTELQQSLASLSDTIARFTGGTPSPSLQNAQNRINELQNQYSGSKLTEVKEIRRLVSEGANLHGIDAMHLAAAKYKNEDLSDLLIDGYGMGVEDFDHIGRRLIHVAACCQNADGLRVLIEKGTDKRALNREGQTALQELQQVERSMGDFGRVMIGAPGAMMGGSGFYQIRSLLR